MMDPDLARAISDANAILARDGYTSKLAVQPLPQPGRGCLARFLIQHKYSNGLSIS
jgi:hypothetical protein